MINIIINIMNKPKLSVIRKAVNYIGVYLGGVFISASFVLITNDIFYNLVFRRTFNKSNKEIWKEIKPMEFFGTGAKTTFIKNRMLDDENDERMQYYEYLQARKEKLNRNNSSNGDENINRDVEKLNLNIFEKNEKKL